MPSFVGAMIWLVPMWRDANGGMWSCRFMYHREMRNTDTMTGRSSRGDLSITNIRSRTPSKNTIAKDGMVLKAWDSARAHHEPGNNSRR